MMEIRTTRKFKEYRVVELSGRVDASGASGLEEVLEDVIRSEIHLIVDLIDVYFISSQGMRVLLNTKKEVDARSGEMILAGPSGTVREVLAMIGFLHYFTILDSDTDELGYYDFRDNPTSGTQIGS